MTETEAKIFDDLKSKGVDIDSPSWETCRQWLAEHDWKINVLSDYPKGEVRFTVRKGFERIEIMGHSDLEVMGKTILEITQRKEIENQAVS